MALKGKRAHKDQPEHVQGNGSGAGVMPDITPDKLACTVSGLVKTGIKNLLFSIWSEIWKQIKVLDNILLICYIIYEIKNK